MNGREIVAILVVLLLATCLAISAGLYLYGSFR